MSFGTGFEFGVAIGAGGIAIIQLLTGTTQAILVERRALRAEEASIKRIKKAYRDAADQYSEAVRKASQPPKEEDTHGYF